MKSNVKVVNETGIVRDTKVYVNGNLLPDVSRVKLSEISGDNRDSLLMVTVDMVVSEVDVNGVFVEDN